MMLARPQLTALPLLSRFMVVGFAAALVVGGLVGLVLGVRAYPPTAWFAVLEVGVPAGIGGAILGAVVGLLTAAVQRVRHH